MTSAYVLKFSCHDRPGIVAAVSGAIFTVGANILEAQQFEDEATGLFFMRVVFDYNGGRAGIAEVFGSIATQFDMTWTLRSRDEKRRIVIFVSKFDHCLVDLLYRQKICELNVEIVGIISNHDQSQSFAGLAQDIPFHHVPIDKNNKRAQEERQLLIINEAGADLVVLARYMQVLSSEFANALAERCINIHHSFLPGFKGAKPYHQAHARGVKIIGATAHYVTPDLDEGPIIAQDVEHISHVDSPNDLVMKGRDIERRVLARAVRYHVEDRVLVNGPKTVVFAP